MSGWQWTITQSTSLLITLAALTQAQSSAASRSIRGLPACSTSRSTRIQSGSSSWSVGARPVSSTALSPLWLTVSHLGLIVFLSAPHLGVTPDSEIWKSTLADHPLLPGNLAPSHLPVNSPCTLAPFVCRVDVKLKVQLTNFIKNMEQATRLT